MEYKSDGTERVVGDAFDPRDQFRGPNFGCPTYCVLCEHVDLKHDEGICAECIQTPEMKHRREKKNWDFRYILQPIK